MTPFIVLDVAVFVGPAWACLYASFSRAHAPHAHQQFAFVPRAAVLMMPVAKMRRTAPPPRRRTTTWCQTFTISTLARTRLQTCGSWTRSRGRGQRTCTQGQTLRPTSKPGWAGALPHHQTRLARRARRRQLQPNRAGT